MIWVIANKIEEDGSYPTYRYYKKAFADEAIDIYCAGQDDNFSFIKKDDIVIMRTRDKNINYRVRKAQEVIGFSSTVESYLVDCFTHDKDAAKGVLEVHKVRCPKTYKYVHEVVEGNKYFVKPRYGENSVGIDEYSLCTTRKQVAIKCAMLQHKEIVPMVEEFVEGEDATSAIIFTEDGLKVYSAIMKPNSKEGYHTDTTKEEFSFTPKVYKDKRLTEAILKVWHAIGARHYLRIDTRIVDGIPYIIDINMIPGLAPDGYFSKCLEVNGVDYLDGIRMVVGSATY